MKHILTIFAAIFLFCSCSEKEEAGEYDNWPERNQHYVDSIASLANSGTGGWSKILAFTLDPDVEAIAPNNNHYIYVKRLDEGKGTYKPMYNDSIRAHYLGRLIPSDAYPQGLIFDKSFSANVLNEATDVPTLFAVNGLVAGFTTAVMHMEEGDRWQVVIPYELGYGTAASGKIPPYSALLFDVKIARIYPFMKGGNTGWN